MASAGKPHGLEKRKACDLCHIKKIRCDAKKPTCSHCHIYKAQCAYTPHIQRRRKELKHEKKTKSAASVEHRIGQLEEKVQQLAPSIPSLDDATTIAATSYDLPPFVELIPIVEDYFTNLNSIVPLFDRNNFMRMLGEWQTRGDVAAWAAINVVLALSWRHRATSRLPDEYLDPEKCIKNVQSVLGDLVARDRDLLGLQVLLGLVMLLQGMFHPRNTSPIIATAVKLAHRLRLHQKQSESVYSSTESVLERKRVFWITYILDRDISARTEEPYMQQDHDMNVSLPPSGTEMESVEFVSEDGNKAGFDFFKTRIQLARIQGDIYDCMYSVRAESLPASEQWANSQRLSKALGAWIGAIPAELQPEKLINTSVAPKGAVRHLIMMYFTCLACLHKMHRVFSNDAEWISRLVNYSQRYSEGFTEESTSLSCQSPLPSSNWLTIVGSARSCMKLFRLIDRSDTALIWNVTCTHVSATLVLVTNSLTVQVHCLHDQAESDDRLISEAIVFLEWAAKESGENAIHKLHAACAELACRARVAQRRFFLEQPGASISVKMPALAWLEAEATKSAYYSALALTEAFTQADAKPLTRRTYTLTRT